MRPEGLTWGDSIGAIVRLYYSCPVDSDMPREVKVVSVGPETITVIPQLQDNVSDFMKRFRQNSEVYVSYDDPAGEMCIERNVLAAWRYAYYPTNKDGEPEVKKHNVFNADGYYLGTSMSTAEEG